MNSECKDHQDDCESRITKFEIERRDAMDKYFDARPQLFRTREKELLYEAGFRMAYEIYLNSECKDK